MSPPWSLYREFRIARSKLAHGFLLAAVLATIGIVLILLSHDSVQYGFSIGLINLGLAAGVAIFAWRNARDPGPRMTLDDQGIWFRDWALPKVPWSLVRDAYPTGSRFQPFACLEVDDIEPFLSTLAQADQRKARSNRFIRPTHLLIPSGAIEATLDEILSTVRDSIKYSRSRSDQGDHVQSNEGEAAQSADQNVGHGGELEAQLTGNQSGRSGLSADAPHPARRRAHSAVRSAQQNG